VEVNEPLPLTPGPGVASPAILCFTQLKALDHGAHRAIQDSDAFSQNAGQRLSAGVVKWFHSGIVENRDTSKSGPVKWQDNSKGKASSPAQPRKGLRFMVFLASSPRIHCASSYLFNSKTIVLPADS
jgi:hypothetical protein